MYTLHYLKRLLGLLKLKVLFIPCICWHCVNKAVLTGEIQQFVSNTHISLLSFTFPNLYDIPIFLNTLISQFLFVCCLFVCLLSTLIACVFLWFGFLFTWSTCKQNVSVEYTQFSQFIWCTWLMPCIFCTFKFPLNTLTFPFKTLSQFSTFTFLVNSYTFN